MTTCPVRRKKICHHCGRVVAVRFKFGNNKHMVNHNCPHGILCSASDGILSSNNRYSGRCPECKRNSEPA